MARLQRLKLPKGVEIDEVSNDNFFTHPSARSVPTTLAVKDYLHDEIDKHDQEFMPDGMNRNAIINGNFDIWQRGTSFENIGTGNVYLADRWVSRGSIATTDVYRSTDVPDHGSIYSLEMRCGSNGAYTNIEQRIEQHTAKILGNVPLTISLYAKLVQGTTGLFRVRTRYPSATDNWSNYSDGQTIRDFTLSHEWQRFAAPFTLNSVEIDRGFALNIVTQQNGETELRVRIAQVQLNIGDKPLPFAPRPYAEELALCQRYYRGEVASTPYSQFGSVGLVQTATRAYIPYPVAPSMRVPPTLTYAGDFRLLTGESNYPVTAMYYVGSTSNVVLAVDVASGLTPGQSVILLANNDLTCRINLNAEL